MLRGGLLYKVRTFVAGLFGISSEAARTGRWWEVDLLLVVLLGAFWLGIAAWIKL
jgi:hypothetical protein